MPRVVARATDFHVLLSLVGAGAGITLVPRLAGRNSPAGVRLVDPAEPVTRRIFTVSRRGGERKPAVRVILDAPAAEAAGSPSQPRPPPDPLIPKPEEAIMPLARIDLARGKPAEYRRAIGDVVYAAIIDVLGAPKDDRFIVITEHEGGQLDVSPEYLGIEHSSDVVLIEIALNEGRSVPVKQDFYRTVADGLHDRIGLRREDVIICLVEVKKENWSFGNGIAQYVESG